MTQPFELTRERAFAAIGLRYASRVALDVRSPTRVRIPAADFRLQPRDLFPLMW